jgi:hypothetical protein
METNLITNQMSSRKKLQNRQHQTSRTPNKPTKINKKSQAAGR